MSARSCRVVAEPAGGGQHPQQGPVHPRLGAPVPADLAGGQVEVVGQVPAGHDDSDRAGIVVEALTAERPAHQLREEDAQVLQRLDRRVRVVDGRRQRLDGDVGELPHPEGHVLFGGALVAQTDRHAGAPREGRRVRCRSVRGRCPQPQQRCSFHDDTRPPWWTQPPPGRGPAPAEGARRDAWSGPSQTGTPAPRRPRRAAMVPARRSLLARAGRARSPGACCVRRSS